MSVGNLLKSTVTVAAANDAATVLGFPSVGMVGIQITGTMTGTTITFEATVDGTNWVSLNCMPSLSATAASTATATGAWTVSSGGYASIRARCSTYAAVSPVLTVRYVGS
jgi:hypothetical protein